MNLSHEHPSMVQVTSFLPSVCTSIFPSLWAQGSTLGPVRVAKGPMPPSRVLCPVTCRASSFTVFLSICASSNKVPSVSIVTGMLTVLA